MYSYDSNDLCVCAYVFRLGNLVNGTADIIRHDFFSSIDFVALENYAIPAPWVPRIKNDTDASNFDSVDFDDDDNNDDGYRDASDWDRDF